VTVWTSLLGREPWPEATVSVSAAEHLAVRGRHAGRDGAVDPCTAGDVVVLRWLAGDVGDDVGGGAYGERLGAGRCVLGAGVGVGARECCGGDRGDVLGVDERLGAVTGGYRDHAVNGLQERLAEVLHEPRGTQNRVRDCPAADEIELDGPMGNLGRGLVDAEGAEVGDMANAGGLREIQEARYLVGEISSEDRRHQVDAVDVGQGGAVGGRVVPVEAHIGAVACRCADPEAELDQFGGDSGAGLAGSGEHQCVGRSIGHGSILIATAE
jgi:hypothetical protein